MYAIKPHVISHLIIISDNMQTKKVEGVVGRKKLFLVLVINDTVQPNCVAMVKSEQFHTVPK
jgi:hypothetical protein